MEKENLRIERAYMLLEEREWAKAREQADRILDENPKNADAHFIKLLADYRVQNKQKLLSLNKNFESNINYKRVLQYGDNALIKELTMCLSRIQRRKTIEKENRESKSDEFFAWLAGYLLVGCIGTTIAVGIYVCFEAFGLMNVANTLTSLVITLVVYLATPFLYRAMEGGTTVKKAKKYALINSIVGWLLFNILYLIMDVNAGANTIASITYYFIGKSIFTSKEEKIKRKVKEVEQKCSVKSSDEKQEKKDFIS